MMVWTCPHSALHSRTTNLGFPCGTCVLERLVCFTCRADERKGSATIFRAWQPTVRCNILTDHHMFHSSLQSGVQQILENALLDGHHFVTDGSSLRTGTPVQLSHAFCRSGICRTHLQLQISAEKTDRSPRSPLQSPPHSVAGHRWTACPSI